MPGTLDRADTRIATIGAGMVVVSAVVSIVLGLLLLLIPFGTLTAVAVVFGIQLLVLGVVRIVRGVRVRDLDGWSRTGHLVLGALVVVGALVVLVHPFSTLFVLVLLLGLSWVLDGVADVVDAWRSPRSGGSAVFESVLGLLSVLAGIVVVVAPGASVAALTTLGGALLVILGVVALVSGLAARRRAAA